MAAAESPSLLLLKTHLKQKTAKIQEKHQVADVFFFPKGSLFPKLYFFFFSFFSPRLQNKSTAVESLDFQRLPGSFSFSHSASSWSSSTSSDLTSKQKSRKHYGYHGSSCVPVLFIYLHMGAWVVKIKVFFFAATCSRGAAL